jgi:hypothetical protein
MLRLREQAKSENFPGLYHPSYALGTNPLHRLGKELFVTVSRFILPGFIVCCSDARVFSGGFCTENSLAKMMKPKTIKSWKRRKSTTRMVSMACHPAPTQPTYFVSPLSYCGGNRGIEEGSCSVPRGPKGLRRRGGGQARL